METSYFENEDGVMEKNGQIGRRYSDGENPAGRARQPTHDAIVFADANEDDVVKGRKLGAKLILRVSQVAPTTYYLAGTAPHRAGL